MTALRVLQSVHGQLGVLATAALLHPALLLRRGQRPSRRGRWALVLSAGFAVLAWSAGVFIYPDYRRVVKRPLFHLSTEAGLLFEVKEHFAVAVVCLALGGLVAALVAPAGERAIRRAAALMFALASALSALVVGLGVYVASIHGF